MIRIAPVLLLKDGRLVRSTGFGRHQTIGDPFTQVRRFNEWRIDELIFINISRGDSRGATGRSDIGRSDVSGLAEIQRHVGQECLVPLTWGGRLRTLADAEQAIASGADKVLFTTCLIECPQVVAQCAGVFGSQAVTCGVDYDSSARPLLARTHDARGSSLYSVHDAVRRAIDLGAGEILLHAVDRDGRYCGYDIEGIREVAELSSVPVVALGGARTGADLARAASAGASAVAAANMWHLTESVDLQARSALQDAGYRVRAV